MINALLFPGQGSQEPGMGKELYEELPRARAILDEACEILGWDLKKLMFEGPAEKLTDTRYAQPAIYTCSAMHLEKAREEGIAPAYTAGHSLGEYSALYAAGAFSFETGLRLVSRRGEAMAARNGNGTMAAVLGLTEEELIPLLAPGVVIANLNSRTQNVISGTVKGVEETAAALEERGISVRKLAVSAAFHSPQMAEAAVIMEEEIGRADITAPGAWVVCNVTGKATRDPDEIRRNLTAQITGQVRWYDTITGLVQSGVEQFCEVGHGQVLRKINKTITLRPRCLSI